MFEASGAQRTQQQLEKDVALRMARQRRLSDADNPLSLVAVLDEAVLVRDYGGDEVMRAQLLRLVEAAKLPTVTLYVRPFRGRPRVSVGGSMTLLTFSLPEDPDMLFVDYVVGSLHREDEPDQHYVRDARIKFGRLRENALQPAESVAYIERLAAEIYAP
ncbi:hypothetical protein EV193_1055 [Herbihabitans rhizosphaerae]|uniref:DUF5753 domain-containing protein n=1 Tax=Herbihabitans rhizosphaerae TaxID=1872711 RepID=A0A4Q7KP54_9PSEU|nr:hypothetical protein EV193_1055 [Herbihabitans rhizosphaerae]